MEKTYEKLQKENKNNVEELLKVLKDAKLVGGECKVSEDEARRLLTTTADGSVTLEHFQEVLAKLAAKSGQPLTDLHKTLAQHIGTAAAVVEKAAAALKNVFHSE